MSRAPGSHSTRRPPTESRRRIWNSLRVLKRFTSAEVEATATVSRANLRQYLRALHRARIVAVAVPKRNGHARGHAVWRLVVDLGPLHPIPRSDGSGVYDPNHDRLHPYLEARDERDSARPGVADRAP